MKSHLCCRGVGAMEIVAMDMKVCSGTECFHIAVIIRWTA